MEIEAITQAFRLLPYLFEPEDIIELRTLGTQRLQRWVTLSDARDSIDELVSLGGETNIYFGANPRKSGGGAKAEDVACARCLYADFDNNTTVDQARIAWTDALIPEPTVIVLTGGGVHAWWRLNEPITEMSVHSQYQRALADALGSDSCIHDAPRIMRLPGTINHKYAHKPMAHVHSIDADNIYSLSDFPASTDRAPRRADDPTRVGVGPNTLSDLSEKFLRNGYVMPAGRRQTIFTVACDLSARSWKIDEATKIIMARANMLSLSPIDLLDIPRQIKNAFSRPRLPCLAVAESATPVPDDFALEIKPILELVKNHGSMRRPIIHGLLRAGETMNIISAPKMGKSWLVNALAISASLGRPWLGFSCAKSKVLLIDNELHRETTAHRIPMLCRPMGIDEAELADIFALNLRGNLIDFTKLGPALFDTIERGRYDIVILDAFYRFLPGGTAENDNGAMAQIFNMIDQWAGKLDCCFVLIHHTSKGNQSEKDVTDVGAGAGSMSRAADTHLVLRQHEEDKHFVLDAAVRSWQPIKPMVLRFDFPLFHSDTGKEPRLKKKKSSVKLTPEMLASDFMSGAFESISVVHRRVRRKIPIGRNTIDDIFEIALEDGLIERSEVGGNQTKYRSKNSTVSSSFVSSSFAESRKEEEPVPSSSSSFLSLKGEKKKKKNEQMGLPI